MTLVFAHVSPTTGLFAASDIAIARPTERGVRPVVLPFRKDAGLISGPDYALHGFSQKTAIFGRTMVMYAGAVATALSLIGQIYEASDEGKNQIDLDALVAASGCKPDELADVSLLYHYSLSDGMIHWSVFNADYSHDDEAGGTLFAAGSGCWSFFDNLNVWGGAVNLSPHDQVVCGFLAKIASHSTLEQMGDETLAHMYGGWFELTSRNGDSFRKMPYAFKFWAARKGKLYFDGPVLFGWYHGDVLMITRLDPEMVDGRVIHHQRHLPLNSILRLDTPTGPPQGVTRPDLIIHSVLNLETGATRVFVDTEGCGERMAIEVSAPGIRVAWSKELEQRLLEMAYGLTTGLFISALTLPPEDGLPSANDR